MDFVRHAYSFGDVFTDAPSSDARSPVRCVLAPFVAMPSFGDVSFLIFFVFYQKMTSCQLQTVDAKRSDHVAALRSVASGDDATV